MLDGHFLNPIDLSDHDRCAREIGGLQGLTEDADS